MNQHIDPADMLPEPPERFEPSADELAAQYGETDRFDPLRRKDLSVSGDCIVLPRSGEVLRRSAVVAIEPRGCGLRSSVGKINSYHAGATITLCSGGSITWRMTDAGLFQWEGHARDHAKRVLAVVGPAIMDGGSR